MAEQMQPDNAQAQAPAQPDNAQAQAAPQMDPDTAMDVLSVVFSQAIQDGMDPGFKSITFAVGDNGDVTVVSESAGGAKYEGVMAAADVADALGMEPAEGAETGE